MPVTAPVRFRGVFRTDDAARAVYSESAGIGQVWPLAVAVPADANDVALLVRWAQDGAHPMIPRGSGSSQTGGAIGEGVIVDLSRLRLLDAPDNSRRRVRAEAGVLRGEISRAASSAGLRFPVDPSSGEFCTIGGMVSTNAAGPHSLKHGSTRRWVTALDCVFDDGSAATVRRGEPAPDIPAVTRFMDRAHARILGADPAGLSHPEVRKDSSGYGLAAYAASGDLIDLLVGSEGTLAIFTAVELALIPTAAATATVLLAFRDLERAVEAAVAARELGAVACELLDRTFLAIAEAGDHPLPVPADTEAVLLIEVEAPDAAEANRLSRHLLAEVQRFGLSAAVAASELKGEQELWSLRHAASPALARLDARLKSMQFVEDAAVPPRAVAQYVHGVRRILAGAETSGVIFGHAGDANIHVNPLVDVSDPRWRERVERIFQEVTDLVVQLGGTTSGEHGDGRLRAPILARTWSSATVELFALVKHSFDPANILNPGAKLPLPGQPLIGAVKYDPALNPLPIAARRALDTVERERAYSRSRLDLL